MNARNTLALATLAMLAGWIIAGERNQVQAQNQMQSQANTIAQPVPCYEIPTTGNEAVRLRVPSGNSVAGQQVLLDRCTGESWVFINKWVRLERDSL